jgi:hypothetical protein
MVVLEKISKFQMFPGFLSLSSAKTCQHILEKFEETLFSC